MKQFLSKIILVSLALAIVAPSASLAASKQVNIEKMDRIIAVVDQSVITEQELADRTQSIKAQLSKKGGELPPEKVLQKQILERLIADSLQLQLAAQTGIKIDDSQVDKAIERIAEQNKLSLTDFKKALEADGVPFYKFKEDIRNEITIARLREREVDNRIVITEGEVDNYLTSKNNQPGETDDYNISQILIQLPEDSSPEDLEKAKTRTEQVYKALSSGMSFEKASASFSNAPNALEGGGLGWRNAKQLPPEFLELVTSLSPGEIAKPIRSASGVHVFKLNERRTNTGAMMIDQTHVRHILLKINEVTSEKEAKQKIDQIKERIDHGTLFEDMARQYSEDGSASNGGDLGWVNPGDTVPAFEKVMGALAIGEVSSAVRTPFGWHLIQVTERRKQDMSQESARVKARQEIRARKAEETYTDWLRELRDRAFVEMHLEDKF